MSKEPNPYLEVLEQGDQRFLNALRCDPMQTSALKAAIIVLEGILEKP